MLLLLGCAEPEGEKPPDDTGTPVLRGALSLRWPLTDETLIGQRVGVDHDPAVYDEGLAAAQCWDYLGRAFPWCYDEHRGSDYLLADGFTAMDAGSTPIVAAAPGVVVEAEDGNYDRCHATLDGVDCDGYEMAPNYVAIEHDGGFVTLYYHMKMDSVAVAVGDEVACGDTLGLVGSSGNSSAPHLHVQLEDADGTVIDPYAGPESQPETWWTEQGDDEGFPGMACG